MKRDPLSVVVADRFLDTVRSAGVRRCGPDPERERLHRDPHALDGLSAQEALAYKSRAKRRFDDAAKDLGWSNYEIAEQLLGDREKESTIRGYRNRWDLVRWPDDEMVARIEALAESERLRAFAVGGAR